MEKIYQFIPGQTPEPSIDLASSGKVQLKNSHLYLAADIAMQAFGDTQQVYVVYYNNLKILLLAPITDELFKQAHECSMLFLKTRTAQGDRSLSLEEIIMDHDLDDTDRDLEYLGAPGVQMLQVKIE